MSILKGNQSDDLTLKYLLEKNKGGGGGGTGDIPEPATEQPKMDGTADVGESEKYAREDHVHPTDTSRASQASVDGKVSKSGDTMTGDLTIDNEELFALSRNITDGTAVSAFTGGNGAVTFKDSLGAIIGRIRSGFYTDGRQVLQFYSRRNVNGSNVDNTLGVGAYSNGNPYVNLSAPNAWMTALASATTTVETTISDVVTAASGYTINSVTFAKWGKVANLYITITKTAAVTTATSLTMATLKSGYRPTDARCPLLGQSSTIQYGSITSAGSLAAYGTWAANTSKIFLATYVLA